MLAGNKETIRRVVLTILIITTIISIVKHDNLFSPFSWYHHRHYSHRPHYYQLSTSTLSSPLFSTSSMLSHKSHHHQTGGSCNSSRCNSPRTAVESRPRFAHYSMRQPPCLPRSPPRGKLRKKHSHSKSKGPIPIPPVQILTLRTCLPRHRTLHEIGGAMTIAIVIIITCTTTTSTNHHHHHPVTQSPTHPRSHPLFVSSRPLVPSI